MSSTVRHWKDVELTLNQRDVNTILLCLQADIKRCNQIIEGGNGRDEITKRLAGLQSARAALRRYRQR